MNSEKKVKAGHCFVACVEGKEQERHSRQSIQ